MQSQSHSRFALTHAEPVALVARAASTTKAPAVLRPCALNLECRSTQAGSRTRKLAAERGYDGNTASFANDCAEDEVRRVIREGRVPAAWRELRRHDEKYGEGSGRA